MKTWNNEKYVASNDFRGKNNHYAWQLVENEEQEWPTARSKYLPRPTKGSIEWQWALQLERATRPHQLSIAARWQEQKTRLFATPQQESQRLPLRNRLIGSGSLAAAMGVMEAGVMQPTSTPAILGSLGLALAVGAARYGDLRRRTLPRAQEALAPPPVDALDNDDKELLQAAYRLTPIPREDYGVFDRRSEIELANALPMFAIDQKNSTKLVRLLEWIDQRRTQEVQSSTLRLRDLRDDGRYSVGLAAAAYREFAVADVNESFGIAGDAATPLSLLALARIDQPAAFMDIFRDDVAEFGRQQEYVRTAQVRIEDWRQELQTAGENEFLDDQMRRLHGEYRHTLWQTRARDIRLASLAFSHQARLLAPDQQIASGKTQNERWQTSVELFCSLPLSALSMNMQELLFDTTSLCMNMAQEGDYGERAARIVAYIAKKQLDVDDESRHTEAWRRVTEIANGGS